MEGASILLTPPTGTKVPPLLLRRALKDFGSVKSCIPLSDGRIAAKFESLSTELPPALIVGETTLKITKEEPRRAKGTIHARDLIGCSEVEVKDELGDQVCEVRALPSRFSAAGASGRFLLSFPGTLPDVVVLDCGLRLSVRAHIPMPLRCRSCFVYGHHENECTKPKLCSNCNETAHEGPCSKPPSCAACGGEHPVTSSECEIWKKEMAIRRVRTVEGVSYSEAVKKVIAPPKPAATNRRPAVLPSPAQPTLPKAMSYADATRARPQPPPDTNTDATAMLLAAINRLEAAVTAQNITVNRLLDQNAILISMLKPAPVSSPPPSAGTRSKRLRSSAAVPASQPRINVALATAPAETPSGDSSRPETPHTPATVFDLGKDTVSSPLAKNYATYDYKEKNM